MKSHVPDNVFLTGATGLLGSRLLKLLIERSTCKINLLIRGLNKKEAVERVNNLLSALGKRSRLKSPGNKNRIRVFVGDLLRQDLGLNSSESKYLLGHVNKIYHCAASTSFTESLEGVRKMNLLGTRNILDFAKQAKKINSFEHVSTIFVAGDHPGKFSEGDLDLNQDFNNNYEQSKFEAEKLILENYSNYKFAVRIYRPGVIIGDYPNGEVLNPGLLYKLFRLLIMRTIPTIPVHRDARLNIIPANIAAEMIYVLSTKSKFSRTYHILMPEDFKIKSVINMICSLFAVDPPRIISFARFHKMSISPVVNRFLEPFLPYFRFNAVIDASETFSELADMGFISRALDDKYFFSAFNFFQCAFLNKEKLSNNTGGSKICH